MIFRTTPANWKYVLFGILPAPHIPTVYAHHKVHEVDPHVGIKLGKKADVNVDVFAVGYGITDRITAYVGIPIYEARVQVDYKRQKKSAPKSAFNIF